MVEKIKLLIYFAIAILFFCISRADDIINIKFYRPSDADLAKDMARTSLITTVCHIIAMVAAVIGILLD